MTSVGEEGEADKTSGFFCSPLDREEQATDVQLSKIDVFIRKGALQLWASCEPQPFLNSGLGKPVTRLCVTRKNIEPVQVH